MTYRPREFWEQRLTEQFDLRGTGETGMPLAYNRACYALRRDVLTRALAAQGVTPSGKTVLDVGCGTGFFVDYYSSRGARVTGLDLAAVSVERLRARFPEARFLQGDISETELAERFDIVNVFDVLYHIVDEVRWESAVRRLARATKPGGLMLVTDLFTDSDGLAEHNRIRPLERYRELLEAEGLTIGPRYPTHVLLNTDLGPLRFLNRAPGLLRAIDQVLLRVGAGGGANHLLVSRRPLTAGPSGG